MKKGVLLIDTQLGFEPSSIKVPAFRSLLKISGTLEELQEKLSLPVNQGQLDSLIEVEMTEENYDAHKIFSLDELVTNFDIEGFEIVKHRASFKNQVRGAADLYTNRQLEDLSPRDVFLELIGKHQYEEETHREILSAFEELLQEAGQIENPNAI